MIDEMVRTNAEMRDAITSLGALLSCDEPPDRAALSAIRHRISRSAGEHLKLLDTIVCPALANGPSEAHRSGGLQIKDMLLNLYGSSAKHIGRWNTTEILANWQGYREEVRFFLAGIEKRMGVEETVIYPLLRSVESRC